MKKTMNRKEFEQFIFEEYSTEPDYPWMKDPNYAVFRHADSRKWFALIMDIPKSRLGLQEPGIVDVVNFKCNPGLIRSLLEEPGIYPAYHMNKQHWVTVALDGSVPADEIKMLLDLSFEATV